jgi:hypothetical protein
MPGPHRTAPAAVMTSCLLAGLALAGCGSAGPLSNGQLRNRAAGICLAADQALALIPTPSAPVGGTPFLGSGIKVVQTEVRQLSALRADDPRYRRAVGEVSLELRAMRSAARGLHSGNDPVVAMKTLQSRLTPIERRADREWQELGVRDCQNR